MNEESWQKPERNEQYDEHLNDSYPSLRIAGVSISPSDALYHCDPVAYRCGLADYEDWKERNYV